MGMLELQNVDKVYRGRGKPPVHAVRALDMEVGKGEIVALLGSSGCGKTSTLRMIAGSRMSRPAPSRSASGASRSCRRPGAG